MVHVWTASSWPMTLRALGGPGRSQSKCQSKRASSISHSKEECPWAADGKAGWVPTIVHSPTKISDCLSGPVGCDGGSECFCMGISLSWSCLIRPKPLTWRSPEVSFQTILIVHYLKMHVKGMQVFETPSCRTPVQVKSSESSLSRKAISPRNSAVAQVSAR